MPRLAAPCVAQACVSQATAALTAGTAAPSTPLCVVASAAARPACAARTAAWHLAVSPVGPLCALQGRSVPRAMCAVQLTGRCAAQPAANRGRFACWVCVLLLGPHLVGRPCVPWGRRAWMGCVVRQARRPVAVAAARGATPAFWGSSVRLLAAPCAAMARFATRRSSVRAVCCAVTRGRASAGAPAALGRISARLGAA